MALVDGVKYGLSSHSFSSEKKTVIFVKLTDSALRAIEDCLQLQHKTGQHATLQFLGNEGRIHIPSSHSIDGHSFDFSLQSNADIEGPQGSFECIQQCGSRSLESMGPLPFKMRIHAKDDVYDLTRKRINFVEDKRKKDCAKEIKSNNVDIGRKVKKRIGAGGLQLPLPQRKEPSPISVSSYPNPKSTSNSSSSSSLLGSGSHSNNNSNNKYFNGFGSSANGGGGGYGGYGGNNGGGNHGSNNSNYKHGGPLHPHSNGPSSKMGHGNNMDITRRPLRERLIHMLALKPLKKPELMSKIYKDGIKEKEKKMLMMILQSVSQLKDNVYNLSRGIWNDVHEDWPFYTEEERQIMKRRKPQNLTPPGSDCSVGSGTSGSSSSPRSTTSGSGHSPSSYSSSTLSMNNYTSTHHLSNSNFTSSPALSSASNNAAFGNNMTKASSQNYSSHSQNSSIPTSQPQGVKRSNPNLSSCDSNNNSSGGGLLSSHGGVAGDLLGGVGGILPAVGSDNIPTKKQRISNFKRPNCSNSSSNLVNSNNSSSSSSNSSSSANNANNALLDIRDNSRDSPLHQPPHKETPPHHPHPHHRNGIISQNGNNAEDRVMSPSLSNGASGIIAKSNVNSGLGPHASVNVIANVVNANVVNNQKKDHHTSPPYNINNQSSNHNHNNRRDKLLVKSEQQDNGHGSSGVGMDIDMTDPDMDGHDHDNDDDFIPMDIGGGSGVVAGTAATVSLNNPPSVVLSNVNVKSTSSPSSVSINPPSSAHHIADPAFGTVVTLINNNSSNNILRDESSNYIKDNLNSASNNNNSGLIVKREIRERDQQYNSNSNSNSNLNSGGNLSEHNGSVVNLLSGCNRVTSTTSSGGSNFHTPQSSHSSPDSQISGFIASSTNHNQTSLSVNNSINNNSNSLSIESLGPGGGTGPGRGRSRDRVNVKDPRGGIERERDRTSSSTRLNGRVSDRDSRDRDRVGNGSASGNSGGGGGERENDRPRGRERERGESNRDRDRHRDSEWPVKIETETPPSFNTEYTTIRTLEQRNRYKADFNAAYAEYLDLHSVIDKVSKKFAQLEERLRKEDKGSEGYQVVRDQIIKEYNFNKNSSKYVDARARYAYMHEKLSYIKRLVLEFDSLHSTETSSIASASSAPTSVALPPPSSSAITNNSSTLPTSPDDEYF